MNICLVSSSGGHLFQLIQLNSCWEQHRVFWIVPDTQDVRFLLKNNKIDCFSYYPESRNFVNAVMNLALAIRILSRKRPDVIISSGAGIAPPFFLAAKIMGIHTIYIEPIDFIRKPSLTGVISQYLVDLFLIQHPIQKKFFRRKTHYWGSTLDL